MKVFVLVLLIALVVFQNTYAQCIRPGIPNILGGCGCDCGYGVPACASTVLASPAIPTTIVQSNSVAASLADTLSLLTVSSLLAETLPLGPNMVTVAPPYGCGVMGPGYGCGCGGYYY